ncbi:TlpA family protein disulfide reductase, partial [Oryzihumus sp.]
MPALTGLLAGLLAGCAGSTPAAATVPGPAAEHSPTAGATVGRSDADRYPLGLTVFPVGQRRALPTLRGQTLAGPALALSSLKGRTVVLNVWASWCEPCRTELPGLASLATQLRASGVRFVGLDEDTDPGAAASAVRSTRSAYPHLVDRGTLLARLSP